MKPAAAHAAGPPCTGFSTLCRRAQSLLIVPEAQATSGPITLIVDSTGLRVQGDRSWMQEKHGLPKARKTWRKLHIGFDPEGGELVTSCLTTEHVGDPCALPKPLAGVAGPVRRLGPMTERRPSQRSGTRLARLIIPPPRNAIPGACGTRNAHIDLTNTHGRMTWQKATGYGQRSRGEAQIGRYKQVIGPELSSRKMETQTTETRIALKALNRMTRLGHAA